MERIIRVTGKGRLAVKPDITVMDIEIKGLEKSYEKAVESSALKSQTIKDALEECGLDRKKIKTSDFNVRTKYESHYDRNDNYKSKFIGYEFEHNLNIKFDIDNVLLGKILYALGKCGIDVEFNFYYSVKDPSKCIDELLANAIEDSKVKAQVLTKAAGVRLKDIVLIDYSWGEVRVQSGFKRLNSIPISEEAIGSKHALNIDIEEEDIDLNEDVTVEWVIE